MGNKWFVVDYHNQYVPPEAIAVLAKTPIGKMISSMGNENGPGTMRYL